MAVGKSLQIERRRSGSIMEFLGLDYEAVEPITEIAYDIWKSISRVSLSTITRGYFDSRI